MHNRWWYILALVLVIFTSHTTARRTEMQLPASRGFLMYRTNLINQKACTCSTIFSCSCCETVTLFFTRMQKRLCSNFMYQRNGLNVDISLGSDTIKTTTVTSYVPFKLCATIPGSLFSSMCVNVMELNQYSRSIAVCLRHEIRSKTQQWKINYTCIALSTLLPTVNPVTSAMIIMTTGAMTTSSTTMRPAMSAATTMRPATSAATTTRPAMTTPMRPVMMTSTTRRPAMSPITTRRPPPSQMMMPAMNPMMMTAVNPMMMPAVNPMMMLAVNPMMMPAVNPMMVSAVNPMMMSAVNPMMMPSNQTNDIIRLKRSKGSVSEETTSVRSDSPSSENIRTQRTSFFQRRRRPATRIFRFHKIHVGDSYDSKNRARIVNGDVIPRLGLTSTVAPQAFRTLVTVRNVELMKTDAAVKNPTSGNIMIADTTKPFRFPPDNLYDRAKNFPSRIPPVVQASLEKERAVQSSREPVTFVTGGAGNPANNKTDRLIFPD